MALMKAGAVIITQPKLTSTKRRSGAYRDTSRRISNNQRGEATENAPAGTTDIFLSPQAGRLVENV
jgi:hypothetical protein